MAQLIYVEVAIRITDDVDPNGVIENCTFNFTYEHILDAEISAIAETDTDENVYGS